MGNPTTYFNGKKNWTFTWQSGRQLKKAVSGNTTINNTYDIDGIRETKTVGGVTHTYTTLDGKVVREAYGNVKVDYLYDNTGRPYELIVTEGTTKYTGFYILNLQGDVIGIVDTSGTKAVTYEYSAWGTLIGNSTNGSTNGSKLNQYNALKYRGYYYDADLAMYYLGSRFYDTEICRFINADDLDYLGASGDFIGYNLYAYCANNPVNNYDSLGMFPVWAAAAIGGGIAGGIISAVSYVVTGKLTGQEGSWKEGLRVISVGILAGAASGTLGVLSVGLGVKRWASLGIGVLTGIITGIESKDFCAGVSSAFFTAASCYAGTFINMDGLKPFMVGVSTFTTSLLIGTQTEIASVTLQNTKIPSAIGCRAPGGMTLNDYRNYIIGLGGDF